MAVLNISRRKSLMLLINVLGIIGLFIFQSIWYQEVHMESLIMPRSAINKSVIKNMHATDISHSERRTSMPLLGWRKNVNWRPGAKLDIYNFLINPVEKCKIGKDNNITLLVLVKSAPGNIQRRDAARRTYIKGAENVNLPARVVFILGESESQEERDDVYMESETHADILRVGFLDHYYNLTIKLIMGFKWMINYCSSEFLMTMDDDVVIDIVTLVNDLNAIPKSDRSQMVIGTRGVGYKPHRNSESKWYVPEEFYPEKTYPPFPFGHGYVISQDVVLKLFLISRETPSLVPFDDVYCGILLNKMGIKIIHRPQWYRDRHPTEKNHDYLKIEVPAQNMDKAWEEFRRN
ncbi:lactosylceramide 1,3-N-acetyl-beta-D-glucosaminyltransferase-like [Lytechinus variegatus]|uniref:lactosylceramide 1,3-N-acetyl-beta-D-glucosaminyltransferase-like n=1 Tax=Lytechinus variegatus TaxID=7654 RepID=UPI001BB1D05F|nr:lactosylceramide 1,3-N-acetyl-beta-D-glucosaminyltransferase-like [Lytechinus variegatus]